MKKYPLTVAPMYESDDCFSGSFRGFESKGHQDKEAFAREVIKLIHEWDGTWDDLRPQDVVHHQGYLVPATDNNGQECTLYHDTREVKRGVHRFTSVWLSDCIVLWPPTGIYGEEGDLDTYDLSDFLGGDPVGPEPIQGARKP